MGFDRILEEWERRGDRSAESSRDGSSSAGGADPSWAERFPPDRDSIRAKEGDEPPPRSDGSTVWRRRPYQDCLDLHGLAVREVRGEMDRFIGSMRRRGFRKGLVIHGKGNHSANGAVLEPAVREYLERSPEVGEFRHASRRDGGSGATWFLLRQRSL